MKRVHIIGIGGIGISALAQYYKAMGWRVTGSDASRSEITDDMVRRGIPVAIGNRAGNVGRPDLVVHVAALAKTNPELVRAWKLGVPVKSYPEAIGELTREYDTVAISGSHGKSTTTALIGLIALRAGLDPTIIVGTKLRELGGTNFRLGKSHLLVLEADEWNKSFHYYHPKVAVLLNVDAEHLDIYKNYAGVVAGFARYVKNVRDGGTVVANAKDKGVRRVIANNANWFRNNANKVVWFNEKTPRYKLMIPGVHNQWNADAAWAVAKLLGIKKSVADAVFRSYNGAWRRLEKLNVISHKLLVSTVYSDYAHHPTEIRATLQALRERHPKGRIICVYEPHQEERLTRLFREFATAFRGADKLVLLPIYRVLGREEKGGKKSLDLAHVLRQAEVFYAPSFPVAMNMLAADLMDKRAVIVFMGAGTIDSEVRKYFGIR